MRYYLDAQNKRYLSTTMKSLSEQNTIYIFLDI